MEPGVLETLAEAVVSHPSTVFFDRDHFLGYFSGLNLDYPVQRLDLHQSSRGVNSYHHLGFYYWINNGVVSYRDWPLDSFPVNPALVQGLRASETDFSLLAKVENYWEVEEENYIEHKRIVVVPGMEEEHLLRGWEERNAFYFLEAPGFPGIPKTKLISHDRFLRECKR